MPLYKEYIPKPRDCLLYLFSGRKIKVTIDPTQFRGIESIPSAVDYLLSGKIVAK